jgi:uncharacterized metal-binding protein
MNSACEKKQVPKLIFSCSGAADVGELADRVTRALSKKEYNKMYCLAGLGAGLENFINHTKSASDILVIDGCPADCAKKVIQNAGIKDFQCMRVTDYGFIKGSAEVNNDAITSLTQIASEILNGK